MTPGSRAMAGTTATSASRSCWSRRERPPTRSAYQSALDEIQQIVTRDDPAAIYYAQPEWLTVLRRDIVGFTPDLVVGDLIDFYALHRG